MQRCRDTSGRRGFILLQGLIGVVVISAIASLSVDIGIFETAKAELQRSADAAALAGAAVMHNGGTQANASIEATRYAQANAVNGEQLPTASIETTFGAYVGDTFTPGLLPTEAVRVRLSRTKAAGNPIKLVCSQLFGLYTVDANAVAIVRIHTDDTYNIVGIESAKFTSLGVLAKIDGRFVSNGDVNIGYPLGLFVQVTGEARSYGGQTKVGSLASVGGSTAKLTKPLQYHSVVLPAVNDNAQIAGQLNAWNDFTAVAAASIPAGVYVVRDLNLLAGVAIRLDGPVTFYVTRNCNIAAAANLLGSSSFSATNFKVRVAPGGTVNFLAPILIPLNVDLYAPDSDINIAVGVSAFKGRLIGRSLNIVLPVAGQFIEDQLLPSVDGTVPALSLARP